MKTKEKKPEQKESNEDKPGYCSIGMSRCISCGWQGKYEVSGCPNCHASFCN